MKLSTAKRAALALKDLLSPVCEDGYCRIAGSVRREKSEPRDIELVIIPKWGEAQRDGELFPAVHNLAQLALEGVGGTLVPIKPGVALQRPDNPDSKIWGTSPDALPKWSLKPAGKYWRLWMPKIQASADIFVCSPETWGYNFTIRTGSADFSHGLMVRWNQLGGVCRDARFVDRNGDTLETPEERDVFHHLGIQWVDPPARTGADMIREHV